MFKKSLIALLLAGHVIPTNALASTSSNETPSHRAVIEEYTGLWCGNCPRGWAAMETMSEKYPDDFICIAYHSGGMYTRQDPMCVTSNFPNTISGYPSAIIDRASGELDPYHGSDMTTYKMSIENDWKERCGITAPANVGLTAELSIDGNSVTISSNVNFPIQPDGSGYKVEFVLVADSLKNSRWKQQNYFYGREDYRYNEFMGQFIDIPDAVGGLHFNDVFIGSSRLSGENVALPSPISQGDSFDLTYTFDLPPIQSIYGEPVIQDKRNLKAIVLLLDSRGEIVNANKTRVNSDAYNAGIEDIIADTVEGESRYYDLSGHRIAFPQKGINIVIAPNGKARKVIIR